MANITSGAEQWARDTASQSARARCASANLRDATITPVDLAYDPFPKQQQFHSSPAKYRLFGGAAGPGKSKALLMEAILQAHDHPNANTLLLRRTFPELEQSLLLYFRRDVPRELYKSFNESKHLVTWWNGSTTWFGYCQSENDVYQYQGAEFLFIGIDELTLFTLRQWQFLTSRNRCPIPGAFPCMAGATNPGNIGHAWVKSLWIDKQPAPGIECPAEYDPADYDFIPARVSDNPIYAGDENYLKVLRALPSHLRRAFLDGSWDVFAGQYFDCFDYSRHVRRAEEIGPTLREKSWWPRWISIDWGFEHPAAAYWHTQIGLPCRRNDRAPEASARGAREITERGRSVPPAAVAGAQPSAAANCVVTFREYVTRRTPPRELARDIVARSASSDDGTREKIDAIYLSPDAFARRTDEASIAEQMGDVFVAAGLPRPVPADDDRVGGWMLMYQMLDAAGRSSQADGMTVLPEHPRDAFGRSSRPADPAWLLTDNCIELIRTLPSLVRDQARVEDVEKIDGDDPADAARYGLKSRYGARLSG